MRRSFASTGFGSAQLLDSAGQPLLAWTAVTPKYHVQGSGWGPARQDLRLATRTGTRWTTSPLSTRNSLGTFPNLVAISRHDDRLVAIVADDQNKAVLLHQ